MWDTYYISFKYMKTIRNIKITFTGKVTHVLILSKT